MLKERKNFFKFQVECECVSVSLQNVVTEFFNELVFYSEDEDKELILDTKGRRVIITPQRSANGILLDVFIENELEGEETIEYYIDEGYVLEQINLIVKDSVRNKTFEKTINDNISDLITDMEVEVELPPKVAECINFITVNVEEKSIQAISEVCFEELKDQAFLDKLHSLISIDLI